MQTHLALEAERIPLRENSSPGWTGTMFMEIKLLFLPPSFAGYMWDASKRDMASRHCSKWDNKGAGTKYVGTDLFGQRKKINRM